MQGDPQAGDTIEAPVNDFDTAIIWIKSPFHWSAPG
jgi:hypothetical protein